MTEWDDFRLFLALYRCGSLRGAAEQLGVNHSTVSRRVYRLNKNYGAALLEKTPMGYSATAAGESVLKIALEMEQSFTQATRELQANNQQLTGNLRLSLPEAIASHLIFDELLNFQSEYPGLQLQIDATYAFASLDKMEADVVIRGCNTPPEHLLGKRIGNMNLGVYVRKDKLHSLHEVKWALADKTHTTQNWFLNSGAVTLPVGWCIDNFHLRYQAVLSGKAIARAPCYIADPNPELIRLPGSGLTPLFDLWVLTHQDFSNTPRIRVLLEYLYKGLAPKRELLRGNQ